MHLHYMFGITLHNDDKRKLSLQNTKEIKTLDIVFYMNNSLINQNKVIITRCREKYVLTLVYRQTKSAMDFINKESHQNVNILDQICDSTVPSDIDLIIEQGLEEISTQVSASVQNSQSYMCAQSYIHGNEDTYTGNVGSPNSTSASNKHQEK